MKVCIVDDDYTSRILLAEFFEDEGWEVVIFGHPDELSDKNSNLIQELMDKNTKLLLMDIRFGRDENGITAGLQTVNTIVKQKYLAPSCVVLFLSQFGRHMIGFDKIKATLDEHSIKCYWLDKPVDFIHLVEIVSYHT